MPAVGSEKVRWARHEFVFETADVDELQVRTTLLRVTTRVAAHVALLLSLLLVLTKPAAAVRACAAAGGAVRAGGDAGHGSGRE